MSKREAEATMNTCEMLNKHGACMTPQKAPRPACGQARRQRLTRPTLPVRASEQPSAHEAEAGAAPSRDPPPSATTSANSTRSFGLFKTKSGLDISLGMTELFWRASERGELSLELVRKTLPADVLTLDDVAKVCRSLTQAGVKLADAAVLESIKPTVPRPPAESIYLKEDTASFQNSLQPTREAQRGPECTPAALLGRMEEADLEMRHILYELLALARNIAANVRASQQFLNHALKSHASVCQMPLIDVERQTIEALEEFARMPCEVFLRDCDRLEAAAARFQQARSELIRSHLYLVASIAGTYLNRGLPPHQLVRDGISGLIRAVGKFGYQREGRFSGYAACWIRQRIRGVLPARLCSEESPTQRAASDNTTNSEQSITGN
jgi:Sigma-70 region 2